MTLEADTIWFGAYEAILDATYGKVNRRLTPVQRVSFGYRIIDITIGALAANSQFLALKESGELFKQDHTSTIPLLLNGKRYVVEFTPGAEGQSLRVVGDTGSFSVEVRPDSEREGDKSTIVCGSNTDDVDAVKNALRLSYQLELDIRQLGAV